MDSILIIAGETSGEKYGAALVREFKRIHPEMEFFGIGGKHMQAAGVRLSFTIEDLAVVGLFEIVSQLPRIHSIFRRIKAEARITRPRAAVLIDSPDFNLRLAKALKRLSIPVLYYISPTVWAWRKNRLKSVKKSVDKMMLIFPFEEQIYSQKKIPAAYVGHPLLEQIEVKMTQQEFFHKYGLDPQKKIIALLPGSRESEIKFHMPVLIKAAEEIQAKHNVQYVLILADNLERSLVESYLSPSLPKILILDSNRKAALKFSHLALSSCGTANLEAALLETPLVSFYRISPLSYHLGINFVKIRSFSIVNILAGKKIIPELIQKSFTQKNLVAEALLLLNSSSKRKTMLAGIKSIKSLLGPARASRNAARELENLIQSL